MLLMPVWKHHDDKIMTVSLWILMMPNCKNTNYDAYLIELNILVNFFLIKKIIVKPCKIVKLNYSNC